MRINSLDLTRCTEQCAILAALLAGRGETRKNESRDVSSGRLKPNPSAMKPKPAPRKPIESLMGYLYDSYCNARLVHMHPNHDEVKRRWGYATAFIGRYANQIESGMDLDLAAAPVDGIRDLLKGKDGGSISVLAGGEKGFLYPR